MRIKLTEDDRSLLVLVDGELDLATAPELDGVLTRAESADLEILVDLSRVSFIDCTALHVLLEHSRVPTTTRRLRVTRGSAQVQRLIELSGVAHLLSFVEA